jgi:hypothetical protein
MNVLSLLSLAVATVAMLLAIPVTAAHKKQVPVPTLAVWLVGAALFVTWVVVTTRAGVRADEEDTQGNIFATISWLIGAAVVASAALVVQRRNRDKVCRLNVSKVSNNLAHPRRGHPGQTHCAAGIPVGPGAACRTRSPQQVTPGGTTSPGVTA